MNIKEFENLVRSYGTTDANWPEDRRDSARKFLSQSEDAREIFEEHRALDDALNRYQVAFDTNRLEARILESLPATQGFLDRIIEWLTPDSHEPREIWRPALAATLPLVIGVVLGSSLSIDVLDTSQADTWEDEIYLLALDIEESESLP